MNHSSTLDLPSSPAPHEDKPLGAPDSPSKKLMYLHNNPEGGSHGKSGKKGKNEKHDEYGGFGITIKPINN